MSQAHSVALACLIGAVLWLWVIVHNRDPIMGRWLKTALVICVGVAIWQASDLMLGVWQFVGLCVVLLVMVIVRQRRQMIRRMQTLDEADEQDLAMMHGLGQV